MNYNDKCTDLMRKIDLIHNGSIKGTEKDLNIAYESLTVFSMLHEMQRRNEEAKKKP